MTFDLPNRVSAAFDVSAFDEAISAHGIHFVHYRGMTNPVGLIDRYDSRRPDVDHSGSSNGLIYTKAGCVQALFTGNSKDLRAIEGGFLNAATAQLTLRRFYENSNEPVYLHPMDRLYLKEESVVVTHQQLVEAHESGTDRLKFPACKVLDLIDASNNRYSQGADFDISDGQIVWKTQNRPGPNPELGVGRVYAVRFLYRPFWYVDRMIHEIRVAQFIDPSTGQRKTVRMPQSAMIQREYVYEAEPNDDEAPKSNRKAPAPRDGGFGAR
jgi:hypothetical protein